MKYLGVQLGGAPSDTGAAPPSHPLTLGGAPPFAPPFAPPLHPLQTGAAPPGFGGAPPLHPPAPSKVLDFGILPMYLSFQVHLWSSVLWMLEEYYNDDVCAHSSKISFLLIKCMFVKPGVLINKEESEENKKWTDRALMLEYGRLDLIEVEEERDGEWIQQIRARCFPPPPQSPLPGMAQISTTNGLPGEKQENSGATRDSPVSWS